MAFVLDLDGVIWLGDQPIPGGAEAVHRLRDAGQPVLFFTNNSFPTVKEHVKKLATMGIESSPAEMLTSAQAAAGLLARTERAIVCGGHGIVEALEERGAEVLPFDHHSAPDAVLVGFDPTFDYERLTISSSAVREGARLIGTNDDPTYPSAEGLIPGGGSLLAAVACASGKAPIVAGKPNEAAARLIAERLAGATSAGMDRGPNGSSREVNFVVGDRPSTDGLFACRLGWRFGLVHTGVTPAGHKNVEPRPDLEAGSLLDLVKQLLGGLSTTRP